MHKCTGIQAAVMCTAGTVEVAHWRKDEWEDTVRSLDADVDILVFPGDDSIDISNFDWTTGPKSSSSSSSPPPAAAAACSSSSSSRFVGDQERYRIVMIEASWQRGLTMSRQLIQTREQLHLPPLRMISLPNGIVGKYWRYHEMGNSAVSTIEAIGYAAQAAGVSEKQLATLLLLFRLQRHRVMDNIHAHGAKIPRAIAVSGFGDGDWRNCSDATEKS